MTSHAFKRVSYASLDSRHKEAFNFQKVSAALADYGFLTIRLSSDWRGADFIAQHMDGSTFLKVQLKARLTFDKKYRDKDLYVCFPHAEDWYLYPHDELLEKVLASGSIESTRSWKIGGSYSYPRLSKKLKTLLSPYRLDA